MGQAQGQAEQRVEAGAPPSATIQQEKPLIFKLL
jgi:hypothetical protein